MGSCIVLRTQNPSALLWSVRYSCVWIGVHHEQVLLSSVKLHGRYSLGTLFGVWPLLGIRSNWILGFEHFLFFRFDWCHCLAWGILFLTRWNGCRRTMHQLRWTVNSFLHNLHSVEWTYALFPLSWVHIFFRVMLTDHNLGFCWGLDLLEVCILFILNLSQFLFFDLLIRDLINLLLLIKISFDIVFWIRLYLVSFWLWFFG
jgi:hypothetical protein